MVPPLDLNQPIEVDTYKIPPRKSPKNKLILRKHLDKANIEDEGYYFCNGSGRKAILKKKGTNYEAEDIILKRLEWIEQT